MTSSTANNISSMLRPAEALVFLSSLITLTHRSGQHAIYDLVIRASPVVEIKLQAWTQALHNIPITNHGRLRLLDRKKRTLHHIQQVDGIIRLLRRQETSSGVARFFWLIHCVWVDLLYLSSLPGAVQVLTDSNTTTGPSTQYREYGSSIIDEVNWLVDSLYCSFVRELQMSYERIPVYPAVLPIQAAKC